MGYKPTKQRDKKKTPPKTSITHRLRTDLGWSVAVTIATELVWFERFTGSQPSHKLKVKSSNITLPRRSQSIRHFRVQKKCSTSFVITKNCLWSPSPQGVCVFSSVPFIIIIIVRKSFVNSLCISSKIIFLRGHIESCPNWKNIWSVQVCTILQ